MATYYRLPVTLSLMILLAACGGGKDPDADVMADDAAAQPGAAVDTAPQPTASAPKAPEVVMPVEVSNEAITLGTSANGSQVLKAARSSFRLTDTVHAGISGGHPPGTKARIYWTNQKTGLSDKEETKDVADDGAVFTFDKASGMKPGRYSVQVDVGDKPVGIVDFEVN